MKSLKWLTGILLLVAVPTVAVAQGTVVPANTSGTLFLTNGFATGGSSGVMAPAAGGFQFEVLTAPSSVTTVDASLQQLLSPPWSDTGIHMTNVTFASGGRIASSVGSPAVAANWPVGMSNSFIVVGWSTGAGTSWAQLAAQLSGAQFFLSSWHKAPGDFPDYWCIGASTIGVRAAGLPDGTGAPALFGAAADSQGVPVIGPTVLYTTVTPEPSVPAITASGLLLIALHSRRKSRIQQRMS